MRRVTEFEDYRVVNPGDLSNPRISLVVSLSRQNSLCTSPNKTSYQLQETTALVAKKCALFPAKWSSASWAFLGGGGSEARVQGEKLYLEMANTKWYIPLTDLHNILRTSSSHVELNCEWFEECHVTNIYICNCSLWRGRQVFPIVQLICHLHVKCSNWASPLRVRYSKLQNTLELGVLFWLSMQSDNISRGSISR